MSIFSSLKVPALRADDRTLSYVLSRELSSEFPLTLLVMPDSGGIDALISDFHFYFNNLTTAGGDSERSAVHFPSWEVLPFDALSPAVEISAHRNEILSKLAGDATQLAPLLVSSTRALMQRVVPREHLRQSDFTIRVGESLPREDLISHLTAFGYTRTSIVEELGQVAVRGAVVDLFAPGLLGPIRLEYFGDEIDSIRRFDSASQRTIEPVEQATVIPVTEFLIDRHGRSDSVLPDMDSALTKIRARARELELPERKFESILEALETGTIDSGLEHHIPVVNDALETVFDYLPKDTRVVIYDPLGVERSAEDFDELVSERAHAAGEDLRFFADPDSMYLSSNELLTALHDRVTTVCTSLALHETLPTDDDVQPQRQAHSNDELRQALASSSRHEQAFEPLAAALRRRQVKGCRLAFVASTDSRVERFIDLMSPYGFQVRRSNEAFRAWSEAQLTARDERNLISVLLGSLSYGVYDQARGISVISESDIFPQLAQRKRGVSASKSVRRFLGETSELSENDYVVHVDHGVGIYRGLKQLQVDGVPGDFLHLEYAEESRLFLPIEQIEKIQKYVASEGKKPKLNKLGTKTWEKSKGRVKERVTELAGQLIALYASREITRGISFGPVTVADQSFADSFPFTETPDQQKAIDDVLADMGREQPMDRLVCGDVGYGKTEVAVRASFKAIQSGFQVAILVPTTILADQHFATFKERFSDHPFTVESVSRFNSTAENRSVVERLADGRVDLVVGTHRLLQRDVRFKNLGLLVIDEEHRFGVSHKEKLKRFRRDVDVLTLTATPIPRTLHMSMLGIRDLSVIETAPNDRQFVRTYITPYEDKVVREAIMRELGRGGQVFYIHNRVQTIHAVADELRDLVPEAKIVVAHGQMKDQELEGIMHRFIAGEEDVLVSTTIVESGLDIPNANTILIRKADHFGLAELYQLRGRVGRSARRAYAYLLISDPRSLGKDAKKRLGVLQSLDDLGQGFRLALQDMEIRGAGNLLGKDQSGHVEAVGFDLYSQILKETVKEMLEERDRNQESAVKVPIVDPELSLGFAAFIPRQYIPDVAQRLMLYQRLASLPSEHAGIELAEEVADRFGRRPEEVDMLLEQMILRRLAKDYGVTTIRYRDGAVTLTFHPDMPVNGDAVMKLVGSSPRRYSVTPSMALRIQVDDSVRSPRDIAKLLREILTRVCPVEAIASPQPSGVGSSA